MREYLVELAEYIFDAIHEHDGTLKNRFVAGRSPGGDPQFDVDEVAERAVLEYVSRGDQAVALYSEDGGLIRFDDDPEYLLIVDPIDGTRPTAAGLETSCVSIAAAPFAEDAKVKDVEFALLKELKTGNYLYADAHSAGLRSSGYSASLPSLSDTVDLERMFWSVEFNGHPARLMIDAYGHLIDRSANTGALFVFSSASYSISRIITGQLDAYADIGNRLLKDDPGLRSAFEDVGGGEVLHLFPYDIAAAVFLAEKAGVVITDGYGAPLGETLLTDLGSDNQRSCVAASTPELHEKLLGAIKWRTAPTGATVSHARNTRGRIRA